MDLIDLYIIYIYIWLVVSNMNFIFPFHIWDVILSHWWTHISQDGWNHQPEYDRLTDWHIGWVNYRCKDLGHPADMLGEHGQNVNPWFPSEQRDRTDQAFAQDATCEDWFIGAELHHQHSETFPQTWKETWDILMPLYWLAMRTPDKQAPIDWDVTPT